MKFFKSFIIPCFISLIISFSMFFMAMSYIFIPQTTKYETAEKTESLIDYFESELKDITIIVSVENCPVDFLINIYPKQKDIYVEHSNGSNNQNTRTIRFNVSGFENVINYINGIEIETPYGLPSPTKNQTIIAKDEKVLAYGASIGEIITGEASPSRERKEYYCYIFEEICIKFLKDCTPERYKFLKQNCETDISYTEFYNNYKYLNNGYS